MKKNDIPTAVLSLGFGFFLLIQGFTRFLGVNCTDFSGKTGGIACLLYGMEHSIWRWVLSLVMIGFGVFLVREIFSKK